MLLKMLPADKKADFVYFEKIWENLHGNNYFKAKLIRLQNHFLSFDLKIEHSLQIIST